MQDAAREPGSSGFSLAFTGVLRDDRGEEDLLRGEGDATEAERLRDGAAGDDEAVTIVLRRALHALQGSAGADRRRVTGTAVGARACRPHPTTTGAGAREPRRRTRGAWATPRGQPEHDWETYGMELRAVREAKKEQEQTIVVEGDTEGFGMCSRQHEGLSRSPLTRLTPRT